MKAWQFTEVGQPLRFVDVPEPIVEPGWVLIAVKAAGLCHSDVAIVEGPGAGWLSRTPLTLGHEVAGEILSLGEGVTAYSVGDRVAIAPTVGLRPDVSEGFSPGTGRDGGYAERIVARQDELVPIPAGVSWDQAAAATDAGSTAFRAVKSVGRVTQGTKVGIIGLGGLGLTGARAAVLAGAEVYGVELNKEVFGPALAAGVRECFTDVSSLTPLELDVIVDFAGMGTTTAEAIAAVKPGGRVVQVGLGRMEATISTNLLTMKQIELVGLVGGTPEYIAEIYDLVAEKKMQIATQTMDFTDISEGLGQMQRGEVKGKRLVALLS